MRALFVRHEKNLVRFFRFGLVGTLGFFVDAGVLKLCTQAGPMGLYEGRVVSFLAAVTVTWFFNRRFTFKDSPKAPLFIQWTRFSVVCLGGFAFNYGAYAALISLVPYVAENPTLGVAAGSVAGLFFNFFGAKKIAFPVK